MRKVTQEARQAFFAGRTAKYKKGNTEVRDNKLYLHGNKIAEIEYVTEGGFRCANIYADSCGWMSSTTKERLNGLYPYVSVYQRKGKWFLNDVEWDGKRLHVCSLLDPLAIEKKMVMATIEMFDGAYDETFKEVCELYGNNYKPVLKALHELILDKAVSEAWDEKVQKHVYSLKPELV